MAAKLFFYVGMSFIFMSMLGCREIDYYGYTSPSKELFGGELNIILIGNYDKDGGKKRVNWGFPYNLQISYVVPKDKSLVKMRLEDIEIIGMETEKVYKFASEESDKVRVYNEDKLIRLSIGPLTKDKYEYESYRVTLMATIYENEVKFEKKKVSFMLETDYRTEKRSVWFDEKTSI